jgi:anti-anti-sigma regulatory factor
MSSFEMTAIDGGRRLKLPAVLDLLAAEGLREALKETVVLGGRLELDASQVERMSTPCIQVMLAGARAMADGGVAFSLDQPSDAFMNGFYDLGLAAELAEWTIRQ